MQATICQIREDIMSIKVTGCSANLPAYKIEPGVGRRLLPARVIQSMLLM